jgi:hypothetical protein
VIVLEALARFITPETVRSVLTQTGRQTRRIRRLPATAVVWLVIAIGIWTDLDIPAIWRQVVGILRSLFLALDAKHPPCKSALSQARTRLGACAMRHPASRLACVRSHLDADGSRSNTRGFVYFTLLYKRMRLMALDSVRFEMPDTPANAAAFGRPRTRRNGQSIEGAYPQIHAIFLAETGTHLVVEAYIKRGKKSEFNVVTPLLKRAPPGCLVLQDRGFYGYRPLAEANRRGIHLLGRVGNHVIFRRTETFHDGSYLAVIYPSTKHRRHDTNGLVVRVIEYTLNEPNRTGHGERHRLVTTLLDANLYPARELVVLYHERWEIELGNDELKTHQLHRHVHLRSRTPCGILQELYGLLLAYNAVRFLMHEAAVSVDIDPRRLSFIHAVRVLRETAPLMRAAPASHLPSLYAAMIQHIAQGRLPPRDNRINPRVVKKKMSNFGKKRPEHYHVPKPQTTFCQSVVILK